ncbi:hypothetical protein [Fimbriiglobus ruber]|uniref:Uncharacterized protein n=1 Tax=Fimbriiglobus ruber TaxID=1908690 RepID=A0A225DD77_9BACT|nr:hypothetical protein [Fimbriiglobus ruber]OWK35109.1 hypothetical protein FRUB_09951 [Fimbriiglobus ruber]
MTNRTRRDFLADVGKGMLVASVGPALAADMGLAPAFAGDAPERLTFGDREPLVALMQDTPADKLLPILIAKIQSGTELGTLVGAGALANARTFGGQDYDGYHAFMALVPALTMSKELPEDRRALPVLKVLHRNTQRMQNCGGHKNEVLHPVEAVAELPKDRPAGEVLREATRKKDVAAAERTYAAIAHGDVGEAYNHLQFCVQDEIDVHRVVLAWRSWAILDLVGKDQAHTLLRQSVRFCSAEERGDRTGLRAALPKILDQHRLAGRKVGTREADDAWIEHLAQTIYGGTRAAAADAAAAALAEGMAPEAVGEAISLAANRLVLCDPGRKENEVSAGKPVGSVHGASVGVHASDSANAWRNISRVSDPRNTFASLIVGAYHTAGQAHGQSKQPRPLPEHLEKITAKEAGPLLGEAEAAIRDKDQARAAAAIHRYG